MEEYQSNLIFLSSCLGGWESVSGNPDIYIFQGNDGDYYLLAYCYDKESERGSFFCYDIDWDEKGCYIQVGIKRHQLLEEKCPYGLHIGTWGSYMRN